MNIKIDFNNNKLSKVQAEICNSILRISKKKKIEDITIQEICRDIPIARTTFYYYYQNIREVIDVIQNNYLDKMFNLALELYKFDVNSKEYDEKLNEVFLAIKDNAEIPRIFLIEQPDDIFLKKCEKVIRFHFRDDKVKEKKIKVVAKVCVLTFKLLLTDIEEYTVDDLRKQIIVAKNMIKEL